MKKLKVALVATFAALMSVGLIACRNEEEPPVTDYKISMMDVNRTSFTLTDADDDAAWKTKVLDVLEVQVQYTQNAGRVKLTADKLAIDKSSVELGSVGVYTATVRPIEHNADNMSRELEITIEHDIQNGVCTVDGATLSSEEINVDLSYKGFHTGEHTLNTHGGASVRPFGTVEVEGVDETIKTHTVGRLEKGMTITVTGTARATFSDFGLEDKGYYFPIIGFGDTSSDYVYNGGAGVSVIVRNEGWVLLDGIGSPRLLAAKAGNGVGGAVDTGNYGSHPSDTGAKPLPNYRDHGDGLPAYESWQEWYTYSTGETSNSQTYVQEQKISLSWTYRDDGIIELSFVNTTDAEHTSKLTAYTKVPDSPKGYYDTILHGEYVTMHFDEISILSTRTLTGVQFNGLNADAKKVYLENEMLDFETMNVSITTAQEKNPTPDTQFDVEANIGTEKSPNWVSLSTTPLSQKMIAFRVRRIMGNRVEEAVIPNDQFITVLKNGVNEAYSHNVRVGDVLFENNGTLGQLAFSSAAAGDTAHVVLTLSGSANSLSDAQKAALTGVTAGKYVAFRIWAREGATQFDPNGTITVKSGEADVAGAYVNVTEEYADVVLPVDSDIAQAGVVISGLTKDGVDVHLALSGLECLGVTSAVEHGTLYLDKGGDVTITYTFPEAVSNKDQLRLWINSDNVRGRDMTATEGKTNEFDGEAGSTKVHVVLNEAAKQVVVTYTLPAFDPENLDKFNISLYLDNKLEVMDTVYYDMEFAGDSAGQALNQSMFVQSNGTTLYVALAARMENLQSQMLNVPELNLNLNVGTNESLQFCNIGFRYLRGDFVFYDLLPEGALTAKLVTFGTLDNDRDSDYGLAVVLKVDTTKLGVTAAPFYLELGADTRDVPEFIYQATAENKVVKKTLEAANVGALEFITEASCIQSGFAGYPVTEEGKVVFFAGVKEVGGEHDFDSDNFCRLCGVEREYLGIAQKITLNENEYVQLTGKYSNALQEYIYNGVTLRINAGSDRWYWIRPDSFIAKNDTGTGGDAEDIVHSLDDPENPEDIALRTPVGKMNGADGEEITEATFIEAKRNGSFEYYISFVDGVITVRETLFKNGDSLPYFTYEIKIVDVDRATITTEFGTDACTLNGDAGFVHGNVYNSMIESFGSASFEGYDQTFEIGATFKAAALPVNGLIPVVGTGKAIALTAEQKTALGAPATATHYVAMSVKFVNAITSDVFVNVRAGGKLVEGAHASADGDVLYVIIPTDGTTTQYVIDFGSAVGTNMQSDIALDLSGVVTANVTSAVTNGANLIAGGDVTVVYSGVAVTDDFTVEVNGVSAKKSELAASKDLGNGVTIKSATVSGETFTVVYTIAAPDFEGKIVNYTVNLKNDKGVIQAQDKFGALALPAAALEGDARVSDSVYVQAEGDQLVVFLTGVQTGGTTLRLNANNGSAMAEKTLVQPYDLSFNVTGDGFVFSGSNVLTQNATVAHQSVDGEYVVKLELSLSALGIGADTAYGFEVLPALSAGNTVIYTVPATRAIAAGVSTAVNDAARATLVESSCTSIGVSAESYNDGAFYFNVGVVPSHTWGAANADGVQECSVCHAIMKGGFASATTLGGIAKLEDKSIVDEGLTVSFTVSGASSDWSAVGLTTAEGAVNITLPNLDPWNNTVASVAGATDREKELAALLKGANAWPAGDNLMNGHAYNCFLGTEVYGTITISKATGIRYFVNGVLAVEYPADKIVGTGTAGDFAELFLLLAERIGIRVAPSGVQATDLLVQRGALTEEQAKARFDLYQSEKDYLPKNIAPTHPDWNADPTADANVVLGTAGNGQGYTTDIWKVGLHKGEKLEISGTHTSTGENAWNALVVTAYEGLSFDRVLRTDNFIVGGDTTQDKERWSIVGTPSSTDWDSVKSIVSAANVTVTFDWSVATRIVISMEYEATAGTFTQTWTITKRGSGTLSDEITVGLGIDASYAVFNASTRTTAE